MTPSPNIIDTNVPLAATRTDTPVRCQLACVQLVRRVLKGEVTVIIDSNNDALNEYRKQMYPDPNPSAGLASQFMMYVFNHMGDPSRVYLAHVQKDSDGNYALYPRDPSVTAFDPSDKKWVAIALTYHAETGQVVPIINATDSDWLHYESAWQRLNIHITQLCGDILKPRY